jgi:hypothetical protein
MDYEFVLKKDGKEIASEKGNKQLKEVLERLDSIAVKQKE